MHRKHKKKGLRRKYQKVAAAVAGAALMSSALLPGQAVPKALAAGNTDGRPESPIRYEQRLGEENPVSVVRDNAYKYGFNSDSDRFSLLSRTGNRATVQVRTLGQDFKVDLEKSRNGYWEIATIRGIGNMKYPATYTPASWFNYRHTIDYTTATQPVSQKIIFQTDKFRDWSWNQSTYPPNMSFGIISTDPRINNTATAAVPGEILSQLANIDFSKYIALYTCLGTTDSKGYGIGIERITQVGNNLIVNVRTLSPGAGGTNLSATKSADIIPVERSLFDAWRPTDIIIIDQNGVILFDHQLILRNK